MRFKPFCDKYTTKYFYDIVSITNGQVNPNDPKYRMLPHIGPGNIEKGTGFLLPYNLAFEDHLISSKYLFDESCVIYGKINPHFAKAAYPGFVGLCSADAYPLKPNNQVIPYYLLEMVLSPRFTKFTSAISKRTGMPKVNREDLKPYLFYIPCLDEQKKVVALMTQIDKRIQAQNKIIEKLESLKIGIKERIYLLGKTKEPLERILHEVSEKSTVQNQYPVLSSTVKGLFLQSEYFDRSIASDNNIGYKIVHKGQIIISPQNLWMGNLTSNDKYENGIVSPSYKIYEIDSKYSKKYIHWLLTSKRSFFNYGLVSEQGASIVRRNLNIDAFMELCLPVVKDKNDETKIEKLIDLIEKKLEAEKKRGALLNQQKQFLLSNLFI